MYQEIILAILFLVYVFGAVAFYIASAGAFSIRSGLIWSSLWPLFIVIWMIAEFIHSLGRK